MDCELLSVIELMHLFAVLTFEKPTVVIDPLTRVKVTVVSQCLWEIPPWLIRLQCSCAG